MKNMTIFVNFLSTTGVNQLREQTFLSKNPPKYQDNIVNAALTSMQWRDRFLHNNVTFITLTHQITVLAIGKVSERLH